MDEDDNNSDKPFEASQRKLEDARKKGEIARSQDALTFINLVGFLAALYILFGYVMWPTVTSIGTFLATESQRSMSSDFDGAFNDAMSWALGILSLLFVLPIVLLISYLIAFKQIVFAGDKLKPKLNRISLVANFKKKFGISGVVEFLKSSFKVAVFASLLSFWLADTSERFDVTVTLEESQALQHLLATTLEWFWHLAAAYAVFACIDVLWQRHQHAKKHRMSHKEMKDEHKNEEGDETVRQQRRAKAEEIATNRMLLDVPKSAVIIVNPTHYAVALKWVGAKDEVPRCVAKGVDETAHRIREVAIQAGVPIYRDPSTARQLHASVRIGSIIDHDHYKAVAAAMAYARRIQNMARS